jgi:hypothetical protein
MAEKTIIIVAVVIIVLLLALAGGGAALYFFVYKKGDGGGIIRSCECDASPQDYSKRVDALSDPNFKNKWDSCGGHNLCQQQTCLNAGYCWSPVFTKPGSTGAPWCFKKDI